MSLMVAWSGLVALPTRDRELLESWTRSATVGPELARRARIVLLAADGLSSTEIVGRVGVSRPTVNVWKKRYQAEGLAGLENRANPGCPPRKVAEAEVVARTLEPPPEALGVTHWSTRLLGAEVGLSNVMVARIWRRWGLQPWKQQVFTVGTAPELATTLRGCLGLYLHQPDKAVVLGVDKRSQGQALDRSVPIRAPRSRRPEKPTHGAACCPATLMGALEVATGKVVDTEIVARREQEFLRFLQHVAKAYPRVTLDVVIDIGDLDELPEVLAWLERHPRITLHCTPTRGAWLNLVAVFLWILSRRAARRGRSSGLDGLTTAVCAYNDARDDDRRPFVWIKPVEQVFPGAASSSRTRDSRQ